MGNLSAQGSPEQKPKEELLRGTVSRITFFNEGNGFCVLRAECEKHLREVTLVGELGSAASVGLPFVARGSSYLF